jgi:transcription antitermination factor NusG
LSAKAIDTTQQIPPELPLFSSGAGDRQWFALYTCANQEKRVAAQLEARGVEHFLPLCRSRRNWKDRRVFLDVPLFPGYLFARFAFASRAGVLQARGVVHLVRSNGQACPLPDRDIEALRAGLRGGLRLEPHAYLTAGARVRILHGPLAGMQGILVCRKNLSRVVLSLDLIQRSLAVEMDEGNLAAA